MMEVLSSLGPMPAVPTLTPDDLLGPVKKYLTEVDAELLARHEARSDPSEVINARTDAIDRLLISLYHLAEKTYQKDSSEQEFRACLVSQGGYGRRELCLRSDIDLLFLHDGKSQDFIRFLNEKILQNLWDAGLEIGFAVRTVRDCRRLMEEDLTILTSLIDCRYLAGDRGLLGEFDRMFERYFASEKNRESFLKTKLAENKERKEKFGASVYLLEPNLKEGEGGLRDYHSLYWMIRAHDRLLKPQDLVARGYLSQGEFEELWKALTFLWTVRNELHRRAGRRMDQLLFEHQEPIAHWMGFVNTPEFLGVELFMQRYYSEAAAIRQLTEKAFRRLVQKEPELFPPTKTTLQDPHYRIVDGRLAAVSQDLFQREPIHFLQVFERARDAGVEIDELTRDRIEKEISRIDETFRRSPEAGTLFRHILSRPKGLGDLLLRMNDCGVLGSFLPEFQKLRFRVQHDLYHVYTVDVHSIFSVGELGKLCDGLYAKNHPTLTQVVQDIERKDLLAFAILYHDIGKGEGRGHVEKGAPIIRTAAARLGFPETDHDVAEFLERSHLIMTHLAFRRDLEDQNMIIQFARAMQNLDLLNMLYVLTFCDVKGVSPEAMTDWKASLLEYLFLKTRAVLQKGTFAKERASALVPKILETVLARYAQEEDRAKCRQFSTMMPPRYFLATPPETIARHVGLWEKFADDPIVFDARYLEKEGLNEITIFTVETPSLFSRMTGILAAHNINILEAQLTLSLKGHALQSFKVTDHEGRPIDSEEKWERVARDLRDVMAGRVPIETLVAERFKPSIFKRKVARRVATRVDSDNDISAFYTVIDIYAHDRTGLLYQITSTLSALGLYVDVSKISTKVDQVADTFYVKDIFGHKILSKEKLEKIRDILTKVIEEEPTPHWRPPTQNL